MRRLPLLSDVANDAPALVGLPAPIPARQALHLPEAGDLSPAARAILLAVRDALVQKSPQVFAIDARLDDAERAELWDMLGEGEVSIVVQGSARYEIEETSLPGVFRVRTRRSDGDSLHLEVGPVPAVVAAAALHATLPELPLEEPAPDGLMNALPLLTELRHRMTTHRAGESNHVVSLSLLPMNDADNTYLARVLGHGPVRAESRGYGTCRVTATARRGIWSVQHFNVMGTMILDTLEIGGVPDALIAADVDLEDSGARLTELLGGGASA